MVILMLNINFYYINKIQLQFIKLFTIEFNIIFYSTDMSWRIQAIFLFRNVEQHHKNRIPYPYSSIVFPFDFHHNISFPKHTAIIRHPLMVRVFVLLAHRFSMNHILSARQRELDSSFQQINEFCASTTARSARADEHVDHGAEEPDRVAEEQEDDEPDDAPHPAAVRHRSRSSGTQKLKTELKIKTMKINLVCL